MKITIKDFKYIREILEGLGDNTSSGCVESKLSQRGKIVFILPSQFDSNVNIGTKSNNVQKLGTLEQSYIYLDENYEIVIDIRSDRDKLKI